MYAKKKFTFCYPICLKNEKKELPFILEIATNVRKCGNLSTSAENRCRTVIIWKCKNAKMSDLS